MSRLSTIELRLGPAPYSAVSTEEEILMVMGACDDQRDIDSALTDVQRMQSTADTLSNVVKYAPAIQASTHMDLFLLETAADLAAAGSDVGAADVIPSTESYVGRAPNMEGFKSFIHGLWQSIVSALRTVWDAVASFLSKVIGLVPRMRMWLKYTQHKIDKVPRTWNWDPDLMVGTELFAFSVKDKLPKNADELLTNADILLEHQEFYHGEFLDTAKYCYDQLTTGLIHFDESNPESSLNALCDDVMDLAVRNTPPKLTPKPVVDHRFGTGGYIALPDMPGDRTLFIRRVAISTSATPLERAETIQQNLPTIQDSRYPRKVRPFGESKFKTPDTDQLTKMVGIAVSMCDHLERYDAAMRELHKLRDAMIKGTADMVDRIEDQESIEGPQRLGPYYRAAVRFNAFATAAVVQPCNHLATAAIRSIRAILAICDRVLVLNNLKTPTTA